MKNCWMVRAGRGGIHFEDFEKGYVAIGWSALGDLNQYKSIEELRSRYLESYGSDKPGAVANALAMILKFRDKVTAGDYLITYNPETRQYLVGKDKGQYLHKPNVVSNFDNLRPVEWIGKVNRDLLSPEARNSLGSTLTLFSVNTSVVDEILAILNGSPAAAQNFNPELIENEFSELKEKIVEQSHELIKDRVVALGPDDMEELVAAILRAMGYEAKVSPKGPDRGVDVVASRDGLGLTKPRIKAEVKHREGSMGAPAIRSFIGALREGDSGLYISSGGFTREARYEAERCAFPLTLLDLDDIAELIVRHYENFDLEGKALIRLVRIYWPVSS